MSSLESIINKNISDDRDEAFYVFNVEDVIRKHQQFLELLPRVIPYYAVKANSFPLLLEILLGLGTNFDCASQREINTILRIGGQPNNIIFANPCKSFAFLKYSKAEGIDLMTFDNEEELIKIKAVYPEASLLLRIKVDDSHSTIKLGVKFGAELEEVEYLLMKAKSLELNVIGIAFHVGSGCQDSMEYFTAIQSSRIAFDIGISLGFDMNILDIGGGYPGSDINYYDNEEKTPTFAQIADVINEALDVYYPELSLNSRLTVIAEPGRYYCMSAFTLFANIISKKIIKLNDRNLYMYYINDGIYGSFTDNILVHKSYMPLPLLNANELKRREVYPTILWGPTCDDDDCVKREFEMCEMSVGEWLMFEDMGSYDMQISDYFYNGEPSPKFKIYLSDTAKCVLMKMKNWDKIKETLELYFDENHDFL